jgi:hypothetical protein
VIDLNKTDANHVYPAMTRPQVIDTFMDKVINHVRTQSNRRSHYFYDSAGKSDMCDSTPFNTSAKSKAPASTV